MSARIRAKYVGTVVLGPSYSHPYAASDAYVWDTLADVRRSLASARAGRGIGAHVAEWDYDGAAHEGHWDDSLTPCVDGAYAIVVRNAPGALEALETGEGDQIGGPRY